jgi:hypothetical protein
MKHLFSLLLAFCCFGIAQAQNNEQGPAAKIEFSEASHDFGDIKQGSVVEWTFKFKNVGSVPLVLTNVATTCGCTAPEWPRDAIAPGATSEIKVRFNSTGKTGMQNKVVMVYSNAVNNPERIKIIANIMP